MGYYTDFHLSIDLDLNAEIGLEVKKDREQEVLKTMLELDNNEEGYFGNFVNKDEKTGELTASPDMNAKWYEHEEDMRNLSSKCGDILFKLEGEGEEDNDRWVKYFMNGRMQFCEGVVTVVYEEFDPEKMR